MLPVFPSRPIVILNLTVTLLTYEAKFRLTFLEAPAISSARGNAQADTRDAFLRSGFHPHCQIKCPVHSSAFFPLVYWNNRGKINFIDNASNVTYCDWA